MTPDPRLLKAVLVELSQRQQGMTPDDSIVVQPFIEGQNVEWPVRVEGYTWEQIEAALQWLLDGGWVSSGIIRNQPAIGIFFNSITPRGREEMRRLGI